MKSSQQIVILGFHRSGTSAISQYLSSCGLFLGNKLLGAKVSNPYGHFEDEEFFDINVELLQKSNVHWLASDLRPIYPNDAILARAYALSSSRDMDNQLWGFKDPRTCITLNMWHKVLSNPVYLVVLRNPDSCIESVIRRAQQDKEQLKRNQQGYKFNQLILDNHNIVAQGYANYMHELLKFFNKGPHASLVVNMDELKLGDSPAQDLNKVLKEKHLSEEKLGSTFDPSIFSKNITMDLKIDSQLHQYCYDAFYELQNLIENQKQLKYVSPVPRIISDYKSSDFDTSGIIAKRYIFASRLLNFVDQRIKIYPTLRSFLIKFAKLLLR